ncbi:UNVERIFIED_CONTAM: hypothetical protein FKN15_062915 [Acipenser sinensis]
MLTAVQQQLVRETLMTWLQSQLMNAQPEKTFIRNKAAQVFALMFVTEYLTKWPKFFFDILTVVGLNPRGVDLYLRMLMAIDAEVVDRDIVHTAELMNAQPEKTFIRNKAAQVFALMFVTEYLTKWPKFFFDILTVVGLNPRGVDLYLRMLMAIDAEVVDRDIVHTAEEEDVDFLSRFSKLVNGMGQSLIISWSRLVKVSDMKGAQDTLQAIESKGPLMLQLLAHEDDDISSNIIGFCYDYLHILKQAGSTGAAYGQSWQCAAFMEVEVAIRLLYMLGEALPASHGAHFCGDVAKASALQDMMRTLVTSGVSEYQHTSVVLEFFETVVRYDKFFIVEPQHIPHVLMAFLDHRGLRHSSPKVRSRTSYLFSRFVKTLHKHMSAFIEDILSRIQDLLELSPPENGFQALLSNDDQLFIFEAAGVLIVNSEYNAERKQALMKNLLTPLMEKFTILLDKLPMEQDEGRQATLADCLNHAVGFASRTSKAFSNKQTVKQCGCSEVYRDCLQTFLPALSCPVQKEVLRSGVRTFLHRMIICLEEEVLPFIPSASEHMLKDCEAKDLQEFIPLLNQITAKFKAQVSPFLQQVFMPLVQAIFEVLARPAEENDQNAALEKQMLRRSYFAFLQTVAGSGMSEIIGNQGVENVERVLFTIIQGAVDFPDPIAQKTCFIILSKLVEFWGGKDGLVGFADFIYKHMVPACFLAPLKPTFDLADAQTVLGPECIQYLQQEYLPSLQVAPEIIQEFCQALQQPDSKVFKNYLKIFFQRAKP